ncbi:MAG: AI-2E family transporter [Verrucomicrobiaceae bacterium]
MIGFLVVSRPVLLPVILALILMLILKPLHLMLRKWFRIPSTLAASLIVGLVTGGLVAGGYFLAEPASRYMKEVGKKDVQERLRHVFSPIQEIHADIVEVAEKVDDLADKPVMKEEESEDVPEGEEEGETKVTIESNPEENEVTTEVTSPIKAEKSGGSVRVQIKEDSVGAFYVALKDFGFYILATLVLLLFLLAYGEEMSKRMGEVRGTPEFLLEIEKEVSGYLFTISAINLSLGTAIGLGLWLLGVPNPILWGVMAALLNFIPYAGALIGAGVVTLVSAMEFQTPGMTLAGGALYLVLSTLEGNVITPAVIGRRFEINPIIVFVWVLAWAAIWGLAGMLIGLPLLIIFRILCTQLPSLSRVERAITVRRHPVRKYPVR